MATMTKLTRVANAFLIGVSLLICSQTSLAQEAGSTNSQHGECSYRDAAANDGWGFNHRTGLSCPPRPRPGMDHLVLQLKGTGSAVTTNYDTDGDGVADTTADCFDAFVYDPASGRQIGYGSDCLDVSSNDGGNIRLTGTGFFHLKHGTLVVQGLTTVRPVLQPTTRDGINFTHITGANGDGGVLYGTGRFAGATGKVRLSGQVDMSRLDSDGQIHFDCIFIIDFN